MILRIEDVRQLCSTILAAVDSNELAVLTETLELIQKNGILEMNVTNREYYAKVKLTTGDQEELHATVNANMFLKLISQITTETVELTVKDNCLVVRGNGSYKFPLIFDGDKLLELPEIDIGEKSAEFDIEGDVLNSILQYNSKQLGVGAITRPVQKLYYVDDKGALTFTSGACVNSFTLPAPVKLLLNNRLVKLFKLFKGVPVKFSLGHVMISDDIVQTRVQFVSEDVTITSILSCDDAMINSVPVTAIRGRANDEYPHSVNFNRNALIDTINRIMLFTSSNKELISCSKFEFDHDSVTIHDLTGDNVEIVSYNNDTSNITEKYETILDLNDLKCTLENCSEQYITMKFGNSQAVLIVRGNVTNIIPELHG